MNYPDFNNPSQFVVYKYETSMMRLERLRHHWGWDFTVIEDSENGVWVNHNKSKRFTSRTEFIKNPYTELRECEHCGKVSTPKKVQRRYLFGLQFEFERADRRRSECYEKCTPTLCMGCYNKARPYHEKLSESDELRLAIGRVKREITKANKANHH